MSCDPQRNLVSFNGITVISFQMFVCAFKVINLEFMKRKKKFFYAHKISF